MHAGRVEVPAELRRDIERLWNFNRVDDVLRPVDVAIGLGSHDPGVAEYTADLFHRGLFPLIVFTGANAPTTVDRFPQGEAVHYREIALECGVPRDAILVEPSARHTGENIDLSKELLADRGIQVKSAIITCRPYQQRRAYLTVRKRWPELDAICSAAPISLDEYIRTIGDRDLVINMLVGDTQRIEVYAESGDSAEQPLPEDVRSSCKRLIDAGFTRRLVSR